MQLIKYSNDLTSKKLIEIYVYKQLNNFFSFNQKETESLLKSFNIKMRNLDFELNFVEKRLQKLNELPTYSPSKSQDEEKKLIKRKERLESRTEKTFYQYINKIKKSLKNPSSTSKKKYFTHYEITNILEFHDQEIVICPLIYKIKNIYKLSFVNKDNDNKYYDLITGDLIQSNFLSEINQYIKIQDKLFIKYNFISEKKNKIEKQFISPNEIPNLTQIERILFNLNERQRVAATYKNENLLILAGAGCGKTKTIIARTAYLINQEINPSRIQILTFTKKAAFEIKERINNLIDIKGLGLEASTFHGWCIKLIRNTPEIFGFKEWQIIDRDDQLQIFKKLRGTPQRGEFPKAAELCDTYSFARNTRDSLSNSIKKILPIFINKKEKIAEIMQEYENEKQIHKYLDYDDILDIVATAITQNEEVCLWLSSKYDCILVDEMQDTNQLQWAILQPLSKNTKLFCVGDDAQSIYGFRGASFNNIHSFKEKIPSAEILKLEDNYRSTQEILDISNWLLKKSPLEYNKKLNAVRGNGNKPELHTFNNNFEEAQWIISNLKKRFQIDKIWNNKMILVRSRYLGRNIEIELLKNNIPYIFIGGQKLLEAAHIKDIVSILRIISNNKDEIAWMRFLQLFSGVGVGTASKFTNKLIQEDTIKDCLDLLNTAVYLGTPLGYFFNDISEHNKEIPLIIDKALCFFDDLLKSKYGEHQWSLRKKDFQFLKQLSEKYSSINTFIEEYLLDPIFVSQKDKLENENCVILSTIHSAKGTEKDIVYVSNVSVGSYPSLKDLNNDEDIEEERRVLYVALTRAKEELIITRNLAIDFWIQDADIQKLKNNYFFKGFPSKLVRQIIHKENTNTEISYKSHFYEEPSTKTVSPNLKLIFNFKPNFTPSETINTEEKTDNSINPIIMEYMKTHQKGDVYPEDIKIAVADEYIPNIIGYKKIGKKYGIDEGIIKKWVKIYRNK